MARTRHKRLNQSPFRIGQIGIVMQPGAAMMPPRRRGPGHATLSGWALRRVATPV